MKMRQLYAGLVLAIAANGAHAWAPGTTHDIVIRLGGASAQDANIEALVYNDLCQSANKDRYSFNNSNTSHRAISCTTVTSGFAGLPGNKKLLLIKRSAGGSGFGVQPVVFGQAIDFMRTSAGCSAGSSVSGYTFNCTQTELAVPNAGVSDVDPLMFRGDNVPADFAGQNVTSLGGMTVKSAAGLSFGLAVSKNLRDELQNQLVAAGKLGATCNSTARETEACMPSFTKHQAASILGGQMFDWAQLTINGNDIYTAAGGAAPVSSEIKVCRRENGSGTQATANAAILHYPCGSAAISPASTAGAGSRIVENNAAGNLDSCLADTSNWAFGFQTTERNVSGSLAYRFVKMDGVAPTIQNVWNGKHFFWSEQTFQWKNSESADVKNVMNVIANDAANVARTAARNGSFVHSWGPAGYVSLVSNGHTADLVWDASGTNGTSLNPTTAYQHNFLGDLNNCRVPTIDASSQGAIE